MQPKTRSLSSELAQEMQMILKYSSRTPVGSLENYIALLKNSLANASKQPGRLTAVMEMISDIPTGISETTAGYSLRQQIRYASHPAVAHLFLDLLTECKKQGLSSDAALRFAEEPLDTGLLFSNQTLVDVVYYYAALGNNEIVHSLIEFLLSGKPTLADTHRVDALLTREIKGFGFFNPGTSLLNFIRTGMKPLPQTIYLLWRHGILAEEEVLPLADQQKVLQYILTLPAAEKSNALEHARASKFLKKAYNRHIESFSTPTVVAAPPVPASLPASALPPVYSSIVQAPKSTTKLLAAMPPRPAVQQRQSAPPPYVAPKKTKDPTYTQIDREMAKLPNVLEPVYKREGSASFAQ